MTLIIDGSHWRVQEFDTAIIDFAVNRGMTLDAEDNNAFQVGRRDSNRLVSDLTPGECEYLSSIADDAVDWLCDHTIDGTYYVEDSALWFELDADVASEAQAAYDDEWGV